MRKVYSLTAALAIGVGALAIGSLPADAARYTTDARYARYSATPPNPLIVRGGSDMGGWRP